MPRQTRIGDMTIGYGSHGLSCCGHIIVGIRITGSEDHNTNSLKTSRITDLAIHSCPHCPVNMCIGGSPDKNINSLPTHRLGDIVTEFCGVGITVTGSRNTFVD